MFTSYDGGNKMKFYSRLKKYKASNCEFDCKTQISTSYRWWQVSRRVKGLMLFNGYTYSQSTSRHQSKIRSLLDELGIKIDLYVQAPKGLQDLDSAISYHNSIIETLKKEILNPRSKKEKNEWRLATIIDNKNIVNKLIELTKQVE